jgi:hypothetical protein
VSNPINQEIGQPVPSFSLPGLEGTGPMSLENCLAGRRGGLIVFWSGVCTHCVRYDDYFNHFSHRHPLLGFVAIASRTNESRAQMLSAVRTRGLTFPILVDAGGAVARSWYAQQTPRCYLLGPDGALYYRGAIDNFRMPADPEYIPWLEPAIASFLDGAPVERPETASFGCAIETVYYQIPRQL